ncbi:hypothetical protein RB653_006962 [Dictyostelium firmibasis]|uniref:BTB domain-containing protein n=1 Tax=Dictyostelium firmibasis TaxID=79012 RepID=A0AAN7TUX8_9MYCE
MNDEQITTITSINHKNIEEQDDEINKLTTSSSSSTSSSPSTSYITLNNHTNPPKTTTTETVNSNDISKDSMLKLNVGGEIYYTTLSTLISDSNSMFYLMFGTGRFNVQKGDDGTIFIDRDGRYFHYILNWLRSQFIPFLKDETVRESVMNEARYYQITSLIEYMQFQIGSQPPPPDIEKFSQKEILQLVNLSHPTQPIQLPSANLSGLDLSGLNLKNANLRFANLEGSLLKYCNLEEANLESANLKNCDLRFSNISCCSLQRAQLQNSQLQYSSFVGSNLSDAELCDAQLQNADFQSANLQGSNLQGANLLDTNLHNAKVQGTSFSRVINVQRAKNLKR